MEILKEVWTVYDSLNCMVHEVPLQDEKQQKLANNDCDSCHDLKVIEVYLEVVDDESIL